MYKASDNFIPLVFPNSLIGVLQFTGTSCFYPVFRSITLYLCYFCNLGCSPYPSFNCICLPAFSVKPFLSIPFQPLNSYIDFL